MTVPSTSEMAAQVDATMLERPNVWSTNFQQEPELPQGLVVSNDPKYRA